MIILLISPLLFLIYFIYLTKKRKMISFDIRFGYKCMSCKDTIQTYDVYNKELEKGFKYCLECEREKNLDKVLKNRIKSFRWDFNEFLIKMFKYKLIKFFLIVQVLLIVLSLIIDFIYDGKNFSIISSMINIIYFSLVIMKYRLESMPNTKFFTWL